MIQVTLSVKGAKEGVALNLPATPAEVSEACAWFDRLNIAPREVRIIGANSPVRNIYQYIARADIHNPEEVEKLNTLTAGAVPYPGKQHSSNQWTAPASYIPQNIFQKETNYGQGH